MTVSQLNQITDHVYWLAPDETTDRPTLGVVAGRDGSLIVDAGNSPAHARLLLGEVAAAGLAPPRYLALTHWHWDHWFGAATFNVPTFASTETRRVVAEMVDLDWSDAALDQRVAEGSEIAFCRDMIKAELPDRSNLVLKAPDVAFTAEVELDLGELSGRIVHVGGDHSPDASIVYVPQERIAFIGDCLYEDIFRGPPRYTTHHLFPLIDRLLALAVDVYVWGHAPALMPRANMIAFTTMLRMVGRQVEQAGPQRELVLQALAETWGAVPDEEQVEIVDAFLAGLQNDET